jgi:hypothetical protein
MEAEEKVIWKDNKRLKKYWPWLGEESGFVQSVMKRKKN